MHVRGDRAGRARPPPRCWPRRSARSSATSPGPSRCAGAIAAEPALGAPAARHRRDARRGHRAGRDRRDRESARRRSATASTIPASITDRRRRGLCREAARLPCHRRPGRAREADPRGRGEGGGKAGLTLLRDEGLVVENAGLTEWPVPLLGRFDEDYPRRAARGDPAHHAHEPEIFRLHRRRTASWRRRSCAPPTSTRRMAARRSSRATAGCSPRGCRRALLLGAGPQGAARGAGEEARPDRLPREARHGCRQGRAGREAGALAGRGRDRQRPTPTRPNAPRGSPRPISSPAWSASFPSCRA